MKNIAIVCDSTVSFTQAEAKEYGVYLAPLSVIHGSDEYQDQVTITTEQVNDLLRKGELLQTSQPNLGVLLALFTTIKEKDYDHVFVLSITSHLSGTYSALAQAVEEVQLENVSIIDSYTLGGPVQQAVRLIHKRNQENESIDAILQEINTLLDHTVSLVYPQTLEQLKRGGRISKSAASVAALLKMKVLLRLENRGTTIEKHTISRTETKIFEAILNDFKAHDITPQAYDVYLLSSEADDTCIRLLAFLDHNLGTFSNRFVKLPAVLACHAGVGTMAVQWVPKI